jgi:L-ascorbate 6-phosphate lactonase
MFPWDEELPEGKAALWWLGQAGYYLKSGGYSILIDPYLSDSAGKSHPLFTRSYPPPVNAAEIKADVYIVTHDHLDHLDPETVTAYPHRNTTAFAAPRFAAKKLVQLGIPPKQITVVDQGCSAEVSNVRIDGIFALPTSANVLDTSGYLITFANGKSVYHTSDTAFCGLLLESCPKADVLLSCINGKFGNLNTAQAADLTKAVNPRYVIPNHYDVMALNSENPESFRYACQTAQLSAECIILKPLERFLW